MSNSSPKTDHLTRTQWKPGQSGNPTGKPKGSKHISSWIREILADEDFEYKLPNGKKAKSAPIEAMIKAMIEKAIQGDIRAFDVLCKYGFGTKIELEGNQPLPTPILSNLSK